MLQDVHKQEWIETNTVESSMYEYIYARIDSYYASIQKNYGHDFIASSITNQYYLQNVGIKRVQ